MPPKRKLSLFDQIYAAAQLRYAHLSDQRQQEKACEFWDDLKSRYRGKDLENNSHLLIKKLNEEFTARKIARKQVFIQVILFMFFETISLRLFFAVYKIIINN